MRMVQVFWLFLDIFFSFGVFPSKLLSSKIACVWLSNQTNTQLDLFVSLGS